jgi:hypothetical protein
VRSSPGVQQDLRYAAFTLNSAWYKALVGEYLSFAVRGAADVIVGDAPFYELTRFGALMPRDGPGGGWSLRGIPRQRYSGKVKLIQNLELRSIFWRFNVRKSASPSAPSPSSTPRGSGPTLRPPTRRRRSTAAPSRSAPAAACACAGARPS